METHYMIDFENVSCDGFAGCEKLTKSDYIHVFYTENAKKIDLDILDNHGGSAFITHKVPVGKQSADIHLSTFLGYLIGINHGKDCSFVIVSRDTDFDNIIQFWKEETKANVSRMLKINQPIIQPAPQKQLAVKEKPSKKTSKLNDSNATKLSQEVQMVLNTARFENEMVKEVGELVASHYGEEHFLSKIHNELRTKNANYIEVYELIKSVISKYTPSNKPLMNPEMQQRLSNIDMEPEVIHYVVSVVVKNTGVKNAKNQIYSAIVSKYGQKKGLNIYNQIKNLIQ